MNYCFAICYIISKVDRASKMRKTAKSFAHSHVWRERKKSICQLPKRKWLYICIVNNINVIIHQICFILPLIVVIINARCERTKIHTSFDWLRTVFSGFIYTRLILEPIMTNQQPSYLLIYTVLWCILWYIRLV